MNLGSVLAGAGRIGREYERDVMAGIRDAHQLLANQAAMRALTEHDRMERMRQDMAGMPSVDYGALQQQPHVVVTPGSATEAAPALRPTVAAAPTPIPAPRPAAMPPAVSQASATPAAQAVDPWVAKNRMEEAERAQREALASKYGPFGGLVKWFSDIRADEEARRRAYIAEATGATGATGTSSLPPSSPPAAGVGARVASGRIPQPAVTPSPVSQPAAPNPVTTGRAASPQQAGSPGGYVPITYSAPASAAGQQARLLDVQAKQLMHVIDSWRRAGAPAGGAAEAMQAQSKLVELAAQRVNLELQHAVDFFEHGGDPSAMVGLLNQATGQQFMLYQHPQNPQMVSLGPPNMPPDRLSWATPAQLAQSVRLMSDQALRTLVRQSQLKMMEQQQKALADLLVEQTKGAFSLEKARMAPHVVGINLPGGNQGALIYQNGVATLIDPAAQGPAIAGERPPPRPTATTIPVPQQSAQQPVQPPPVGRIIVPGYQ